MRWLLLKDLQILRRSPLLVALLLAYGGLVGALLGFAVQRDDTKPKVAFLNEVPTSAVGIQVARRRSTPRNTRTGCSSRSTRSVSRRARRRSRRSATAMRSRR